MNDLTEFLIKSIFWFLLSVQLYKYYFPIIKGIMESNFQKL